MYKIVQYYIYACVYIYISSTVIAASQSSAQPAQENFPGNP